MKPGNFAASQGGVALYGGAFDPVHNAHLAMARHALDLPEVQRVVFIPAARSPLKAHPVLACDEDRIAMLEKATAKEPAFAVDDLEIQRGGCSYTVDTVRKYRERWPHLRLFWIIGADQFRLLKNWHAIDELKSMVTFLVMSRPGYELGTAQVDALDYRSVESRLMPESSSMIRTLCREGADIGPFVPSEVEAFISAHGLYRSV